MKVEHNCDVCGTPFMSDSRNLARGWGRCCSKTCAAIKREAMKKPAPEVQPETSLFIEGKHIVTLAGCGNEAKFITRDTLKASELRIGNIIQRTGIIITVYGVIDDTIFFMKDRGWPLFNSVSDCDGLDRNLFNPVPLTDEILRDWCGFMPAKRCEGLTKHGIDLVPAGNSYYDNKTGREITTLHQLQNYVYAVSGIELDVKLPTNQP